ncbi:putative Bracovirus protein MdBV-1-8 [Microplitis demolitor]
MDIVVDFTEYFLPNDRILLKELAIMSLHPYTKNIFIDKHYVFKPPCLWEILPKEYQDDYLNRCKIHGILWQTGYADANLPAKILKEYFNASKRVFVRDMDKINLLFKIVGETDKIILHETSVVSDENPDMSEEKLIIKCIHHQNRNDDNCAYENAFKMKSSLLQKK